MVEPRSSSIHTRSSTPTQTSVALNSGSGKGPYQQANSLRGDTGFYDTALSNTSLTGRYESSKTDPLSVVGGPDFMSSDSNGEFPDGSQPSMSNRGRSLNRRQTGLSRRQSTPTHAYVPPEISHVPPIAAFQPPHLHSGSPQPFDQRAAYVGQYPPPQSLNIAHSAAPSFYPHGFHHPGVPEHSLIPQNIHAMIQAQPPVYPYQHPEGGTSHQLFPPNSSAALYPSIHQGSQNSPPTHPPPGQNNPQFHSLRFPSPISSPYPYSPQSFPAGPQMYQSQYPPTSYPQRFSPEADGQGSWWYLPHPSVSSPQYDNGQSSYAGHYPTNYPPMGETSFNPSHLASSSQMPIAYSASHKASQFQLDSPRPPSASSNLVTGHDSPKVEQPILSTSSVLPRNVSDRPVVRRPYHPNPPASRSEWVMWAGNVPSDTDSEELWIFFSQAPDNPTDDDVYDGVLSIFPITRSSCAFINFESEAQLHAAISRFNGQPLRPNDSRCPRLVCRVRKKDDDLKAGVGGQRGMGIHTKWVRDQKGKAVETGGSAILASTTVSTPDDPPTPPSSTSDQLGPFMSSMSISSDEGSSYQSGVKGHSSSSGSYASTNSSILTRHFPKRYFILKSLTQFDLDLSVEKGLWATQKHNEGILDQAYRTSKEVYLIFGVNKSGEFYGYAKMAGPVLQHSEHRVSWATRTAESPPSSKSSLSPTTTGRTKLHNETIPEEPGSHGWIRTQPQNAFFSPFEERLVDGSPLPMTTPDLPVRSRGMPVAMGGAPLGVQSAPSELGKPHHKVAIPTPPAKSSLGAQDKLGSARNARSQDELLAPIHTDAVGSTNFKLDKMAPIRAIRGPSDLTKGSEPVIQGPAGLGPLSEVEEGEEALGNEEEAGLQQDDEVSKEELWGEEFKIEWICTDRLPFFRTRHIRNPWNHDREVKVSRDGTELEPTVGQSMLEEWERYRVQTAGGVAAVDSMPNGVPRRGLSTSKTSTISNRGRSGTS